MPRGRPSDYDSREAFLLGEIVVEPDLNQIHLDDGSGSVRVESRVMDLLVFLAQSGDRLVTRREIFDGVWGTEFICDNTLTHAMSMLRAALRDAARESTIIETVHGRGYRLLVPATSLERRRLGTRAAQSRYRIVSVSSSTQLRVGANLIGRAAEATVRIDSVWVSRHHARILIEDERQVIEDLDSRNGTYLNGRRVDQALTLDPGDTIFLGKSTDPLRFVEADPQASTEPQLHQTPVAGRSQARQ